MSPLPFPKSAEMIIENQKISYLFRIPENTLNDTQHTLSVFLHGWESNGESFARLFSKNKCFVAIDFPGSGKSSHLQNVFTLEDYTAITQKFLEKFLQKYLQKDEKTSHTKITLIGHSFGGRVIMKLLDMFPGQFSDQTLQKIIFIAVPFYREKTFKTEAIKKMVDISNFILPTCIKSRMKKMAHRMLGENDYFDLAEDETLKKTFQNIVSESSEIHQYLHHLESFSNNQLLCFWGEEDEIIPISFAETVQKKIGKKFKIIPIPKAGHFPWAENPEYFLKKWKTPDL